MTPEEFLKVSGLSFKDPSLLRRALTHRSYLNEHPEAVEDNERLEYLGDAALDFITAAWIYNRFPEMILVFSLFAFPSLVVCEHPLPLPGIGRADRPEGE